MNIFQRYKTIIVIVIIVLILVAVRSAGTEHFKSDARKWYLPSVSQANLITAEKLKTLTADKLIINLGGASVIPDAMNGALTIPPDSILSGKYLQIIKRATGPVILWSAESSVSARIWMVLKQMGISDIYILIPDNESEVMKYKFRPDTMTGPEF